MEQHYKVGGCMVTFNRGGYRFDFKGGSQSITNALETKITDAGGVIKRHTRATEITVADGKATGIKTDDAGCYTASAVISNASAPSTYLSLLGEEHLSPEFAFRVKNGTPATSNLGIVFLGVDADYTKYFPGHTHEIFVGSGTPVSTASVYEMQCLPASVDFTLSNYSALDEMAAPEGKNAIVISAEFMGYDCENEWRFNDNYKSYSDYKQAIAEVLIARAEEILPDLSSHIEVMEVASPKTVEQYTLNPRGSWAVWAIDPETGQTPTNGDEEPVDGLFTAGAWNVGAGQSVVLASGISAATAAAAYLDGLETGDSSGGDTDSGSTADTITVTLNVPEDFTGVPDMLAAMFFDSSTMSGMPSAFGQFISGPEITAGQPFALEVPQTDVSGNVLNGTYYLALTLYCEGGGGGQFPVAGVDWIAANGNGLTLGPGTGAVDAGEMTLMASEP